MSWKNFTTKRKLLLGAAVIVFVIAGALLLLVPFRGTRSLAPQLPPPPLDESVREKSGMTKEQRVAQEMERVIDSWCDAEAGTYNARTTLESLWTDKFGTASPYASRGVPKLINKIHDNAFFRNCEVGVGLFLPGGGIETVGDLQFFLSPCGRDA